MNKSLKYLLSFLLVLFFVSSLFSQTQHSFEDALKRATASALSNAERNQRVAIIHVASPSQDIYELVMDELQSILVGSGFRAMNRNPIKEILADFQIGISDEIDDIVAVNIGTHVESDLVLVGVIDQTRSRVRLKVLDRTADTIGIATEQFSPHSLSNQSSNIVAPTTQTQTPLATSADSRFLHGLWRTSGENEYAWAASEFRRGIPDGQVRQFGRLQFNANGTVTGFHGTFRYNAPRGNNVNHENFVTEVTFNGTYSLNGNNLTIQANVTTREIQRVLGNARNARPQTVRDESRSSPVNQTIELVLNRNTAGAITSFNAPRENSLILNRINYNKQ